MNYQIQRMVNAIRSVLRGEKSVIKLILLNRQMKLFAINLDSPIIDEDLKPSIEVKFRVNFPDAFEILRISSNEYGMPRHMVDEIPCQIKKEHICISGYVGDILAFYGWVAFKSYPLGTRHKIILGSDEAFIYRCHTHQSYRGKRIYPAAIRFMQRWLRNNEYKRVLIDFDSNNRPSERGVLLAGMELQGNYYLRRILLWYWVKFQKNLCRNFTIVGINNGKLKNRYI